MKKTLIISRETTDNEIIAFRENILTYNNIKFQIKQFQEKEKQLKEWFKCSGYSKVIWEVDRENNAVFKIQSTKSIRSTIDKEKLLINLQKYFDLSENDAKEFIEVCSNKQEIESVRIG